MPCTVAFWYISARHINTKNCRDVSMLARRLLEDTVHASGYAYILPCTCYVNRSPTTWTSKIGLHFFDAAVDPHGALTFTTQSQTILNVGIATTSLSLSSRAGICLAVTHSSPGPAILAHRIERHQNSGCNMTTRAIKLPDGESSREMLAFDGYRGRLCLITGGLTSISWITLNDIPNDYFTFCIDITTTLVSKIYTQ
ncbi:hypothetical protein BJ912DRAFT_148735 [Pholiota molesta]|nr:hypothetical protein BJ912DRAFT_148735 [Pholiota molesta]